MELLCTTYNRSIYSNSIIGSKKIMLSCLRVFERTFEFQNKFSGSTIIYLGIPLMYDLIKVMSTRFLIILMFIKVLVFSILHSKPFLLASGIYSLILALEYMFMNTHSTINKEIIKSFFSLIIEPVINL